MKKIILYIAASIDGRIAEPDGGIEWLSKFPITEKPSLTTNRSPNRRHVYVLKLQIYMKLSR